MGSAVKSVGGAVSSGWNAINGGIGDVTRSIAPKVGLGQYKADEYHPNESAFTNNDFFDARKKQLQNQMDAANNRTAPTVNYSPAQVAKLGAANQMSAAQLDPTQQAQWRGQQMTLAGQLTDQGNGVGPSLAQSQLQMGRDANIASAMALAASQRGLTAGQGLRQVADQTTNANQFAAQEAARLRLAEQLQARQQLNDVLSGARGQDIGIAESNAGLAQQAAANNQAATNQFALTNYAGTNAMNQFNAGNNLSAQNSTAQNILNQHSLNDAMARFYNTGLLGEDQNQMQGAQNLEQLKAQIMSGVNSSNAQNYESGQNRIGNFWSKLGQGGVAGAQSGMFGSSAQSMAPLGAAVLS